MADKGGVGPEPAESEKLSETAEHETEVKNEAVTSASSSTSQTSASISPSPAAATASPGATSTLLGARSSLSETSQPILECLTAFSESARPELENIKDATGSSSKASGTSQKATGSSLKVTGSSPKATGSSPKATGSTLMSTGTKPKAGSSPMSTGTKPKAGSSPMSTGTKPKAGSSPMSTGTKPKAGSSPMSTGTKPKAGSSPMSTGTKPKAGSSPISTGATPKTSGTSPSSISTAGSTGAIPRTQVAATKEDQLRMSQNQAAKGKAKKSRKKSKETRSRSRSGSSSDSTAEENVTPSTGFRISPVKKDSIKLKRTGNLVIVPMRLCEPVNKLPVPKRKCKPTKIIVIGMALEIEQYMTVLYKEYPPHEDSPILFFFFPVPDQSVLASVRRNIVVNGIYIKREDMLNGTLTVTLRDKNDTRNITLDIYVDSFEAATVPQPVLPEVQKKCFARICSVRPDKESCTIQLYPAYVDIMSYIMHHFMNEALLNFPDVLPVTNPIPGQAYIYLNNNTRSAFRVRLIDSDDDDTVLTDDLKPACGTQARDPEDSGIAPEETGISQENLPIPSENSGVTCEGETKESEDKNESNLGDKSIKPEERVFKVKCIDYGIERDAEAGNIFEFATSIHLLILRSIPPQGLETNVFQVGTTRDGLESLLNYVVMRLVHIGVVDHGAEGFLPSVEVVNYVAEEHNVLRP